MIPITGATGANGIEIVKLLSCLGVACRALVRNPPKVTALAELPAVDVVQGDLARADTLVSALSGIDGVCHLAARTRVRESWTDPLGYWQANVGGTLTLLGAMLAAGTKRLVLASSCSVYGVSGGDFVTEESPVNPQTAYGICKTLVERDLRPLANKEFLFPYASVVECPQNEVLKKIGPTLASMVLTEDPAFGRSLLDCPQIDRLNIGPAPTTRLTWDQPHEGNLFTHLYHQRAFQQARRAAAAV